MRRLTAILLAFILLVCVANSVEGAGFVTKTYYQDNHGKLVKGYKKINGDKYYFNKKTGELEGRILKITYMNQNLGVRQKGKWTHTSFPNARTWNGFRLGTYGCGITSCAMAITALRGKLTLPTKFNAMKYGFNGKGSNWNVGELTAKKYGLKGKVKNLSKKNAIKHLLKGRFVLVWVYGSIYGGRGNLNGGDSGYGGSHFILVHGYKDGKFAVADPNNLSQSYAWSKKLQTWESFSKHLGNGKKSYCVIWQ